MPSSPQNRRRGIGRIGGSIIDELNEIGEATGKPGIGTRLARELNQKLVAMNARVEAASGQRGTVKYGPMTRRDSKGIQQASMDLQGGRMVGLTSDPTDGSEPITLEYWRKHRMECRRFAQMHQDCIEEEEAAIGTAAAGVLPWFWGYTVHTPDDGSVQFFDLQTTSQRFNTWAFILEEGVSFAFASWSLNSIARTFSPADARFLNFALYNADREKVFDFGGFDLIAWNAAFTPGIPRRFEVTATELAAGEYHLAWFSPSCIDVFCTKSAVVAHDIMNGGPTLATAVNFRTAWEYAMPDYTTAIFPDTLPDTPITSRSASRIPLIFFSET